MGSFFVNNPPPAQYASGQYGDFTPRDANGTPSVGTQQAAMPPHSPPTPGISPPQSLGQTGTQGDPHELFMQAVQELGINPQDFRGNPAVMDKVTNYLNQKYPGMNWANGGARAGDWVSVNGQGFDVLPAGDRNWQWMDDPASSQAGAGGGYDAGAYGYPGGTGLTPTQQIEQTPGYQFDVSQAMNAIQHSAAARGTLLSGGLMKNLGSYIANSVAGPAYQSQINNLYNIAGLGKGAAGMTADAANSYGAGATGLMTGIGNANAGAAIAGGSAYANAANQIGSNVAQGVYNQYNQPNSSSYGNPYGLTPAQQAQASAGYPSRG